MVFTHNNIEKAILRRIPKNRASVAVHLGVEEGVRPGDELLGTAHVAEADLRDKGCECLRILVQGLHVRGLDLVLAP
ncbi:MAG: hypothetical protein Q4Q58_07240, partial [Thermoplasmata archaeon]|nr:hypothetical protein [Thermoplasmata archaeon]